MLLTIKPSRREFFLEKAWKNPEYELISYSTFFPEIWNAYLPNTYLFHIKKYQSLISF